LGEEGGRWREGGGARRMATTMVEPGAVWAMARGDALYRVRVKSRWEDSSPAIVEEVRGEGEVVR
jgi:hypothetical protein